MKILTIIVSALLVPVVPLVAVVVLSTGGAKTPPSPSKPSDSTEFYFDWRKRTGDFPKDKPGYLILTTEDTLTYSKVLPEFVKQKEAMGFYVYVATEKDYGTG